RSARGWKLSRQLGQSMRFSLRQSPVILILSSLALTAAARQIPTAQAAPTAAELTKKLQARYQTVRDFTADFTQTYQGVLQRKAATEKGKLQLKKPSRVRMTYESPEKKVFVADGVQFYS